MKPIVFFLLVFPQLIFVNLPLKAENSNFSSDSFSGNLALIGNELPVAINDTFELILGCGSNSVSGNILTNDFDPNGDAIILSFIHAPNIGIFKIDGYGEFTYSISNSFNGIIIFDYKICEIGNENNYGVAKMVIFVKRDNDCDGIPDDKDIDNDNDGILDIHEGSGLLDFDKDGLTDNLDIDSDNDGITDNEEWQKEGLHISPLKIDLNKNGWDDAYDNYLSGIYYEASDTDYDGTPDFLDFDSDDDKIPDYIEGHDANNDGEPENSILNKDFDSDGLDNAYDIVEGWIQNNNSTGSNSLLIDYNKNGIRDWREINNSAPKVGPENPLSEKLGSDLFSVIYPNPNKGSFKLLVSDLQIEERAKLVIYKINGELILQKTQLETTNEINLGNIKTGTYIIKVFSSKYSSTEKLIITN